MFPPTKRSAERDKRRILPPGRARESMNRATQPVWRKTRPDGGAFRPRWGGNLLRVLSYPTVLPDVESMLDAHPDRFACCRSVRGHPAANPALLGAGLRKPAHALVVPAVRLSRLMGSFLCAGALLSAPSSRAQQAR